MGGLEKETGGEAKRPFLPLRFLPGAPRPSRLALGGGLRCSGERKGGFMGHGVDVTWQPAQLPPPRPRLHEARRRRSRGEGGRRGRRRAAASFPLARYISLSCAAAVFRDAPPRPPPPSLHLPTCLSAFCREGEGDLPGGEGREQELTKKAGKSCGGREGGRPSHMGEQRSFLDLDGGW